MVTFADVKDVHTRWRRSPFSDFSHSTICQILRNINNRSGGRINQSYLGFLGLAPEIINSSVDKLDIITSGGIDGIFDFFGGIVEDRLLRGTSVRVISLDGLDRRIPILEKAYPNFVSQAAGFPDNFGLTMVVGNGLAYKSEQYKSSLDSPVFSGVLGSGIYAEMYAMGFDTMWTHLEQSRRLARRVFTS